MALKLNKAALPDPVEVYQAQKQADAGGDPQAASLCSSCRFGFRITHRDRYDKEIDLRIWCTGPWFESAERMNAVVACNGRIEGEFSPTAAIVESIKKALDTDPYEEMSDEQKAAMLDSELSQLEEEGDGVQKGIETDDSENADDGGAE